MRRDYRWVVLAMAVLGTFAAIGFGRFAYSAVLPSMQEALGLSAAAAGSLASWNLVGYTAMALGGGLLASRFGSRIVIALGLSITAVGMLVTGLADDLVTASVARLLTGVGNGMVLAPAIALMAAWFEPRRLGLASTIVSSGAGLGLVLVGPVVPYIIAWGGEDGWRFAWYFFVVVTLLVAVLSAVLLRNRPHSSAGPRKASGAGVLHGFAQVLRSGYAWHLGLVYLLFGFAFMTFLTFFQKRLIADLGYASATAGLVFLAVGVASVVFGLVYGLVSDRFGRGRAMATTLVLEACAAALFGTSPGIVLLVVAAVLFGSGAFSMPGLMGAACGDRFGARLAAGALGFVTIFIGVGQALGPYVGGTLADALSSFGPSYLVAAGVFLLAAVAALLLDTRRGGRRAPGS